MFDEIFPEGIPPSPIKRIKDASLPVYLYGMGNGAEKMMDVCTRYGIRVDGVFVSDGFRSGKEFIGFTVNTLSEVASMNTNGFIALVCFGCGASDMRRYIGRVRRAGGVVYMPHLPLFGGELFTAEHCIEISEKIERAYSLLSDHCSRRLFADILKYFLTWDPEVLFHGETNSYIYPNFFEGSEFLSAIDGGAYRGDTVLSLTEAFGSIKRLYAFEPDPANFSRLSQIRVSDVDLVFIKKGLHANDGALKFAALKNRGSHFAENGIEIPVTSVDSAVSEKIDLIKLDVEGCESAAIEGARNTITKYKPALYASVYHKTDDIFDIILQLNELNPDYKFAMFRADVCPAWDIILLAK